MNTIHPTVTVSPRLGTLLTQLADTPDLETALQKVLSEYMNLKIAFLRQRVEMFESRWNMKFEMFAAHCESGTLNQDAYSYQVEDDFWAWEEAETLLQHYESLQARWM